MKIIIAGAGEVGFHLAEMLTHEAQDLYIIDQNEDRLNYIQNHIDVIGIRGDATSLGLLKEVKVSACDLLIAATSSEETNMLICMIGKKLGAKKTIARISNYETKLSELEVFFKEMGVDTIISPVELASKEIKRLIYQSAFTDDYEFDNGKLSVFGIAIDQNSPLVDKSIIDTKYLNPNQSFKPLAFLRQGKTHMVYPDSVLQKNDIVYFIATPEGIKEVTTICTNNCFEIKNIMILGASRIGILTAELLEKKFNVTLVEENKTKANQVAEKLKKTLVINADGRDVSILEEENLDDMDAFIALTSDSETNIITSLVAKSRGVKKTIARVENMDYINISQNIGIDTLINKKIIAANEIIKYIRKGEVQAVANLHGVDAEIIEFIVKADTKITRKTLKDLKLPKSVHIAGVIRNNKGFIPFGSFQLQEGDKAVVFVQNSEIDEVEDFFH
ncbi:MAG: Trk system potassium transporter TrkA [Flavobacteriales bacterium]|nr:Trk system potassium transporter TrkA [Flavobacteriales bacterium]MBX2959350.1 Trk system potassium transporter TrkA [Flavobacteriales bacterium]MCL4857432.1 Trk system potassium transporter TrkA [Flavobacteriales bacterium]